MRVLRLVPYLILVLLPGMRSHVRFVAHIAPSGGLRFPKEPTLERRPRRSSMSNENIPTVFIPRCRQPFLMASLLAWIIAEFGNLTALGRSC